MDNATGIREERPVRVDAVAIFVRLDNVVSADRHQPAISNLEFAVKLSQALMLPAILGAKPSAAEDEKSSDRVLAIPRAFYASSCGREVRNRGR